MSKPIIMPSNINLEDAKNYDNVKSYCRSFKYIRDIGCIGVSCIDCALDTNENLKQYELENNIMKKSDREIELEKAIITISNTVLSEGIANNALKIIKEVSEKALKDEPEVGQLYVFNNKDEETVLFAKYLTRTLDGYCSENDNPNMVAWDNCRPLTEQEWKDLGCPVIESKCTRVHHGELGIDLGLAKEAMDLCLRLSEERQFNTFTLHTHMYKAYEIGKKIKESRNEN